MLRSKRLKQSIRMSITALLASSLPWSAPSTADDIRAPAPVTLQRATLTVADLERSLGFYHGILGLTVSARSHYDTPALRQIFKLPPGSRPELVLLDAGSGQPRALALVHAEGVAPDQQGNIHHAPALLFNTAEMDRIHEAMLDSGFEILLAPSPMYDFDGNPFGREAAYLDPDGVRVILFEYE